MATTPKTTPKPVASRATARPAAAAKPDRRQNILLAAEKLFAKFGYHAVSIRNIADEAEVPLALVGYYFGAKQDLYRAIFEHWSTMIQERLASLKEAMAQKDGDRLTRLVEAFIAPVIRLRASAEGEYYDPMAKAFIDAFHSALAAESKSVTRAQVAWCYQFALGALLHHISDTRVHRLSQGENRPSDPAVMPQLVAFIANGMRGAVMQWHPALARKKSK
jgi:AcrR family transcriptional regulator